MTSENKLRSNLQNRVDPWGELHISNELGTWMGNRGILHDDQQKIVKPWDHFHWVTCRLSFKDYERKGATAREKLFTPGNYSELFFPDEATALAAGHRPCSQCRNRRYKEFKAAWVTANRERVKPDTPSFDEMDIVLQGDRVEGNVKKIYEAPLSSLPDGTMVDLKGTAYLIWRMRLHKWSFAGYEEDKVKISPETIVKVLTPISIVQMFDNGFIPQVHSSAFN